MKRSGLIILMVAALLTLGSIGAADLPQAFNFSRYQQMLSSMPFGPGTPGHGKNVSPKDLYIKEAWINPSDGKWHIILSDGREIIRFKQNKDDAIMFPVNPPKIPK